MNETLDERFPAAIRYRLTCAGADGGCVAEDGSPEQGDLEPPSERLVQCVWYDPVFRPGRLATVDGETVVVESPGVWNLEAGPDFLGAVVLVGAQRRRLEGDVEIHLRPADWSRHRHAGDPRYARVLVHVTHHPGALPPGALPPGAVQIALRDALAALPSFSFDNLDPTAYPLAARATPTPCALALEAWSPDDRERFLEAAGEERLRRKAVRLARAIAARGPAQTLYEELMTALGYRHNKAAFRMLAERVTIAGLREASGGDAEHAYALLLGASGLLPAETRGWDGETRDFVRRLWDHWWKARSRWDPPDGQRRAWRLSGLRPLNHPARRLMAAARLFTRPETPDEALVAIAAGEPAAFAGSIRRLLAAPDDGYWSRRLAWGGARTKEPAALLGPDRIRAAVASVIVPFAAASGADGLFREGAGRLLPDEAPSGLVRRMALTLFGPDHARSLWRGGLRQQGLLAVFHDHCLNDRSHCRDCPMPGWLREARRVAAPAG